jgi:hypothetical protein
MTLDAMSVSQAASRADAWPSLTIPPQQDLVDEVARFASAGTWNRTWLAQAVGVPPQASLVVTGQQPAVGGGPLYTLVKVAHAIALAQSLGDAPGGMAPLFWCASEDHDLGEAGHADIITRSGSVERLNVDLGDGRASLRYRPATRWWEALMAHCRHHLGPGPGAAWLEALRPAADEGMGQWLCHLLEQLFQRYQLRCVEGHILRPLWREGIERALAVWPAGALERTRTDLLAAGQADAFGALAGPPLFADLPAGRTAVTIEQASRLLADAPASLSPGAALRPVLQQIALPAALYVAGPGEFRYHAFIAPLYAVLGATRPRLIPRVSVTLVPPWVSRGLQHWKRQAADAGTNPPTQPPSQTLRPALDALTQTLVAAERQAAALTAEMRQRVGTGIARLRREQQRLERSLARGEAHQQAIPSWGAVSGYLRPRGALQERSMSLFQAIWEHGPGVAHQLVDLARTVTPGDHRFLALASSGEYHSTPPAST